MSAAFLLRIKIISAYFNRKSRGRRRVRINVYYTRIPIAETGRAFNVIIAKMVIPLSSLAAKSDKKKGFLYHRIIISSRINIFIERINTFFLDINVNVMKIFRQEKI